VTKALLGIANRQNERETRCECGRVIALHQSLQSIIEPDVFEAIRIVRKCVRNGIGKLMRLSEERPFLREAGRHLLVTIRGKNREIEDVLNNSGLLIVSFFNEERIILNSLCQRFLRRTNGDCGKTNDAINQPQMNTDRHGSENDGKAGVRKSVSICGERD
jgi:hypothetical protein